MFAIPAPGGAGSGGATDPAPAGPAKASDAKDSKAESTDDLKEAKEASEGDEADEAEKPGEGEAGAAEGGAEGDTPAAQAEAIATQQLTIHTLNGLLLTLPATAGASGRAAPAPARGKGESTPGEGPEGEVAARTAPNGSSRANDGPVTATGRGQVNDDRGQGTGRDAGREPARDADRSASAPAATQPAARARTSQATSERTDRPGGVAGVQAEAAAPVRATSEPKPALSINPGAGTGRTQGVGDISGAPRNSEPKRPSVPTDPTGPAQVVRGVLAAVNQRGGKVTLDLDPGELGRMKVELKLDARTATATFHVESPEARRLLEDALPQLRQALTDRGVSLERAEVVAPGQELAGGMSGALAAIQAGAEAVAMVVPRAPEELDLRGDSKRSREGAGEGEGGFERTDGAGDDADSTDGTAARVIIGPGGVDVLA